MRITSIISGFAVVAALATALFAAPPSAGATEKGGKKDTAAIEAKTAVPGKQLLFFMNPNGRPCQMQLDIIDGMKNSLKPLATVTYIKTTESADRKKFSEYGIRGLPSLIILDTSGKELKRLTPGIQDEATILAALRDSGN